MDLNADADTEEGTIKRVMREEIIESFKHLMIEKATGSNECFVEEILAT